MKKKNQTTETSASAAKSGRTTLQKQYIFIIVALVLAILFAVFYFAIYPLLQDQTAAVTYVYDGEYYDGSTLYITGPYKRADIAKIEVKNQNGSYVLTENGSGDSKTFTLEGAENVVLDAYSVAGVVVAAGQPIATAADSKNYRANEYATADDLAKYGLDETSDPSWFRVTLTDGTSYRIFIGDSLPTGSSHYAYIEGETRRNVVENEDGTTSSYYIIYALDVTSSATLLYAKTGLVSTLVGEYVGNGIAYLSNFEIYRNVDGERKHIIQIVANDNPETATSSAWEVDYPRGYTLDDDAFERNIIDLLYYIEAAGVMALGDEIYTPEVYEKYGLDLDPERLEAGTDNNYAILKYACLDSDCEDVYENTLYVSEKQLLADGTECYYVYSPSQYMIFMLDVDTFDFVSWSVTSFTSNRLFFESIGSLDFFSILSADGKTDVRFTLTGNAYTYHVDVTDASGENAFKDENGDDLAYDIEYVKTKYDTEFSGPFEEFRNLYYVLITRMFDVSMDAVEIDDENQSPVYTLESQVIIRDRSEQYYKYESNVRVRDENNSYITVQYHGGNVVVYNLKGKTSSGTTLTYDKAYYNEEAGRYFVKEEDTADGEVKPRSYTYSEDNEVVPTYLALTDTTAEYTVTTYEYKFYDLYDEIVAADGTVTSVLNQTYMLVVPNAVTRTYRIEADGSRMLIDEEMAEGDSVGTYIRRVSVEKLISDTAKLLAGESIDKWAVD